MDKFTGNLRVQVRYEDERDYRLVAIGCSLDQCSSICAEVSKLSCVEDIRISVTDDEYEYKVYTL